MQLHICCKLFEALIAAVFACVHMWEFVGVGREAGFCFHGREFNDVLAMEDDLFRSSRSSVIEVVLCNG
jgi:hypothetical protein